MPPPDAAERHHIGYQEFGLSFQHALSIVQLSITPGLNLIPSSFALVRPMYETLQRGWWFTICATDLHATRFIDDDIFSGGSLAQVAESIETQPPFQNTGFFSRFAQGEWNLYHSFTHGGRAALAIYGHREDMDPDFDPAVILTMLDNAASMSAMATFGMCWVSNLYSPDQVAPRYQEITAIAAELGAHLPLGAA